MSYRASHSSSQSCKPIKKAKLVMGRYLCMCVIFIYSIYKIYVQYILCMCVYTHIYSGLQAKHIVSIL